MRKNTCVWTRKHLPPPLQVVAPDKTIHTFKHCPLSQVLHGWQPSRREHFSLVRCMWPISLCASLLRYQFRNSFIQSLVASSVPRIPLSRTLCSPHLLRLSVNPILFTYNS